MRIAVITARGGSKRIPRKNIKQFCGKPMMAWSIQTAFASQCFDRVIVSTDDNEIADIAREHGAEIPFMRPAALADDHAGTIEVMQHAVGWINREWGRPDAVCCIYATAPLLTPDDLQRGWQVLQDNQSEYAFSVAPYPSPIQRAFRVTGNNRVEMFQPENFEMRSQDLEPAFHDAGQFYWGHTQAWLSGVKLFSSASSPVILPLHRVQDIDTPEDWKRAEMLFKGNFQGDD